MANKYPAIQPEFITFVTKGLDIEIGDNAVKLCQWVNQEIKRQYDDNGKAYWAEKQAREAKGKK